MLIVFQAFYYKQGLSRDGWYRGTKDREGVYCSGYEVKLWARGTRIPILVLASFVILSK